MVFHWDDLTKLAIAALLGAIIGLERELHGRSAGLRTNTIVCLASALLIIVSRESALGATQLLGAGNVNADPARMAAGIVTGIGFLGAGAIMRVRESFIRGLTTAAGIWVVAAVGISVGVGEYILAGAATVLTLIVLVLLARIDKTLGSVLYGALFVEGELKARAKVEDFLTDRITKNLGSIQNKAHKIDRRTGLFELTIMVRTTTRRDFSSIVTDASAIEEIRCVSWKTQ